jgi:hypothetical protein
MEANHADILTQLMKGRDTRWYRGHLGKLTLICVSRARLGYLRGAGLQADEG